MYWVVRHQHGAVYVYNKCVCVNILYWVVILVQYHRILGFVFGSSFFKLTTNTAQTRDRVQHPSSDNEQ